MMTEKEVLERDAKRDIGAELLQSVKEMKAVKVGATHEVDIPEVIEARNKVGLTQVQFADLMGYLSAPCKNESKAEKTK